MSPEVTAAIIAASVSFLTLIGTLAAQLLGRRATSKQLDKTLTEQRTRTLNERFATAAEELGSDKPAVQLAGVYAMAGLADDWEENRQTCVDVLCAYMRMPYKPDPGDKASESDRLAFRASRVVRSTVIRVITARLGEDPAKSWQDLNFHFWGVVFDGGDFHGAKISGGTLDFYGAKFPGAEVDFYSAEFSGGTVNFRNAKFSGGTVDFGGAQFSGGTISFDGAEFSGGTVDFRSVKFSGGTVDFSGAKFSGAEVDFSGAEFCGAEVRFGDAEFSGGIVDFGRAEFSGGTVDFGRAEFSGGTVDFTGTSGRAFPTFPWAADTPPSGVKLPGKEDQSQA